MRDEYSIDAVIAWFADRQWGLVTRFQLLSAGFSAAAIGRCVARRRLRQLYRGVYAAGHRALRPAGVRLAAVLACGEAATLSDAAAAAHLELRASAASIIDVTIPPDRRVHRPGIRIHRRVLLPDEVTVHEGVPVTTPERTLLDLAARFDQRTVERALDQLFVLERYDHPALMRMVTRHAGRPGAPLLAAVVAAHAPGTTLTRSELEERFVRLCDRAGMPRPRVNARVCGFEVDMSWPGVPLVVELDGWKYHRGPQRFRSDRRRDAALAARGIRTLRFSDEQVVDHPREVVTAIRASVEFPSRYAS